MANLKGQAYEIVGNLILKLIVILVISVGWLMMVWALIHNENPSKLLTVATIGTPFSLMAIIVNSLFSKKRKR